MTEQEIKPEPTRADEWELLRQKHLRSKTERPDSSAQGIHHLALLSSDVEKTIDFYQGILEFPLTELFENRDYAGSTHFFSILGTATRWRSSTSRALIWLLIKKCWALCIT